MRISEIFKSLQGEGKYAGCPVLFVRLSGCTRSCSWCDSKYHKKGKIQSVSEVAEEILSYKDVKIVVFTGGEVLLQYKQINDLIGRLCSRLKECNKINFHLETNGDLIKEDDFFGLSLYRYSYICVSPKDVKVTERVLKILSEYLKKDMFDIKVVTDLRTINVDLVKYATMLMPITTYNKNLDREIRKRVWYHCIENNLKYTPRLHVELFGKKRKV